MSTCGQLCYILARSINRLSRLIRTQFVGTLSPTHWFIGFRASYTNEVRVEYCMKSGYERLALHRVRSSTGHGCPCALPSYIAQIQLLGYYSSRRDQRQRWRWRLEAGTCQNKRSHASPAMLVQLPVLTYSDWAAEKGVADSSRRYHYSEVTVSC